MKKRYDILSGLKIHGWWILGILLVTGMLIPYIVLRENAIVVYHDQLDGELIAYILQAKHLFQSGGLPEFMGMDKSALVPPAPMSVLLFCTGHYFAAYVTMQIVGSLAGFHGMYLLGRDLTGRKWIGFLIGVLFAYLPFRPVYGLAQYGIPLLLWCIWQLWKGQDRKRSMICILYCIFYALNSSLVLIGFAVLGFLALVFLCGRGAGKKSVLLAWALMAFVYISENLGLLLQIFGGIGEISHKTEYVLKPVPFLEGLWNGFADGMQHAEDYHIYIMALGAIVILYNVTEYFMDRFKKPEGQGKKAALFQKPIDLLIPVLFCVNFLLSVISAFWDADAGIALRENLKALKGFQLGRVLWLAPAFWYIMLICVLDKGADIFGKIREKKSGKLGGISWKKVLMSAVVFLGMCCLSFQVLKGSNLKPNLQKMLNPNYSSISYSDYYALGVMGQVRDYLDTVSGQDVSEYRVVSLGIDPAAAYYEGFYCLDGYSNNYALSYKHQFRKVIAPELEKSSYLADSFDEWGNRCYLFSSECPGYYTIEKNGFYFQDYSVDTQALLELGGKYLLSAAYIANGEETGLRLMTEVPFETKDSYYRIFVYEITK